MQSSSPISSQFEPKDYDSNGDGVVSRTEYDAKAVGIFFVLDGRHDGYLDEPEIPSWARTVERGEDNRLSLGEWIVYAEAQFDTADMRDGKREGTITKAQLESIELPRP